MARGKGEGSIYKRASDGMWCVGVELPPGIDGKRRRKVVCRKVKGEVTKELRRLKSELGKTGNLSTTSVTLANWSEQWLKEARERLTPNTVDGYARAFRDYINPMLGRKPLDRITPDDVRAFLEALKVTPVDRKLRSGTVPPGTKMLSGATRLRAYKALSVCLDAAHKRQKVSFNACTLVDPPRKDAKVERALSTKEAVTLLQYIAGHPDGALWATFLLTGARRGEVIGLEVERVGATLDLSWQIQRITDPASIPSDMEIRPLRGSLCLVRPKSSSGWRNPPLVEPLATILARHIGDRMSGLVFTRFGEPWDPTTVSKQWKVILEEAGLPADVKLHGARHTVVDLLYEAGVSETVIMEIVGHSSRAVTRSYRTRGNERMVREALEKMSAMLAPPAIESHPSPIDPTQL